MDDDGVVGIVGVHEVGGVDTCRDPRGLCVTVAGRDTDEAVGHEHDAVAGDRQILHPLRRVDDGPARAGESTGGHHDVCLIAGGGDGEDVKIAGDRVTLRVGGKSAGLACEVDAAERGQIRGQLVSGEPSPSARIAPPQATMLLAMMSGPVFRGPGAGSMPSR